MQTLTQRRAQFMIADDLVEAVKRELEILHTLIRVYKIASSAFKGQENDPDPVTICMGVQATALGILTLCNWLTAISEVTAIVYHNVSVEAWEAMDTAMSDVGIVIPQSKAL